MKTLLRVAVAALVLLVLGIVAGGIYVRGTLRGSLPVLDGTVAVAGLDGPVTVARDALGVPTVTGHTREDVARALGFLHAQDRFFQMDLQRRQPAGELSALVGARALAADSEVRVHRFRQVAGEAYRRAAPEWQALLDAYAEGVNAGLSQLESPPFEYLMLRSDPEPWTPEDSILSVLAMFGSLQGRQAAFEQTMWQLRSALPDPLFRFVAMSGSSWDAPASGDAAPRPPVPGPEVADLRATGPDWTPDRRAAIDIDAVDHAAVGSNNWVVDAARSADGGALVANDMHLRLGVPNIWYRASLVSPDPADPLQSLSQHGVTLPGLPALVVGSNGHVAWGFTNTGGDWSDLVRIEPDPRDPARYLTPGGSTPFEVANELIAVKDEAPRPLAIRQTMWGPVVWTDAEGREYAQHWVAHDADVLAGDLSRPERTRTVDELLVAVVGLGIPHQNVSMADRTGRVAWTVGGAIPRRRGLDGFTPESWADGTRGWDGWLDATEQPRIVDPPAGRIWTANAPVVDGAALAIIGDGGYAEPIRAHIIRDRLQAIDKATPRQMLEVQLDDSARFLERWRSLVLETLRRPEARTPVDRQAARAEFARLVETSWDGRASIDSVGYLLVRTFRGEVVRRALGFVTAPALEKDPRFDYARTRRSEGPAWALVETRPMHLLDRRYASWDALLVDAVDAAIAALTMDGRALDTRTWGEANRARIVHPLSSALPLLPRWLDMPAVAMPGDAFTPRAQTPDQGPSQRLVVSPGREAEGLLHMPTGQSAHPLSPYFGAMHRAWADGAPSPLLPGPDQHTLRLVP